jgi:myo-inositol 2-dehydrogenase/D-chiro-inositol 1-dehydrogenase
MSGVLGVALVGAGYISRVYVEVFPRLLGARLVGVASRSRAAATRLADACGASVAVDYGNLDELLRAASVDVVCVNSINRLHAQHAVGAARAGKHVIVEKPLCLTLAEADAMLEAARDAGTGFAYAENLCFAPHYRRARELIASGAVGDVLSARQCEKHGGPYSPWFWSAEEAGGGALLDLGCHGIECLRWLLDKPRVARVSARLATLRHGDRTQLEDDASVTLELEDGTRLVSESSWAARDGGESTLEVQGSEGTLEVDLLGASDLRLRRRDADWQRIPAGPAGDSGYLQELTHFLDCFRKGLTPDERGEDGRAVLEILLAAYASAGRGAPVSLPFDPGDVARPVDLWLG